MPRCPMPRSRRARSPENSVTGYSFRGWPTSGLPRTKASPCDPLQQVDEVLRAERSTDASMTSEDFDHLVYGLIEEGAPVVNPLVARSAVDQWIRLTMNMCSSAGVGPVHRRTCESSPHRVEEDITQGRQEVRLIHRKGGETFLPEVPGPSILTVDLKGITLVCLAQGSCQTLLTRRYDDEVHVIGHQAVGPDVQSVATGVLSQEPNVKSIVVFGEEDPHSAGSALCDVVWQVGHNNSSETRHRTR